MDTSAPAPYYSWGTRHLRTGHGLTLGSQSMAPCCTLGSESEAPAHPHCGEPVLPPPLWTAQEAGWLMEN